MAIEGYYSAAICRRGHKISAIIEPAQTRSEPIPEGCSECGAKVFTACPQCEFRLKGLERGGYPMIGGPEWKAADFCDRCRKPLP